ncbi:MAG: synthase subunit b, partial [Planctomycetota bacterium]
HVSIGQRIRANLGFLASFGLAFIVTSCFAMGADEQPAATSVEKPAEAKSQAESTKPEAAEAKAAEPHDEAKHDAAAGGEHDGEHKGGHHDTTDLSGANAGPKLEGPEEVKSDLAIYTFVVFVLLVGVLLKFAWTPIMSGLDKREQSIAKMIEDAREGTKKAESALREYQQKLAAAQEETREMLARSRQEAEALKEKILAEAKSSAQREKDRALADIRMARDAALQDIAERSVDTAVKLASQIVKREVKSADHSQLIRDAVSRLPSKN